MQWIDEADAVFRGGGVKGLALAGALCGFAEHPTKPVRTWKSVAGASAGAIIACYLATGHDADEMLELMQKTSFGQFADFPGHNKELGIARLLAEHGMAPGKAFESWFDDVLEGATFAKVRKPPAQGQAEEWWLKLIAVDVTGGHLLVLPDDLQHYRDPATGAQIDPDEFPIARAARMSMSIPYFFDPVELQDEQGRTLPDRRRRDALELPGLALGRRSEGHGPRPDATDVRLHALRRPRLRPSGLRHQGHAVAPPLRVRHLPHRGVGLGRALRLAFDPRPHARRRCRRRRDDRLRPVTGEAGATRPQRPGSGEGVPRRLLARRLREHLPRRARAEHCRRGSRVEALTE